MPVSLKQLAARRRMSKPWPLVPTRDAASATAAISRTQAPRL